MTTEQWVALGVAALAGGFARDVVRGVARWITERFKGTVGKHRTELEQAWARGDKEARKRRIIEEFAATCVHMLIAAGLKAPDWPDYHDK